MSSYPTLNGMQYRGPGGDGRLLAATMQRAAWASFLTRDGVRVDPRDITDIPALAKALAHDHATAAAEAPTAAIQLTPVARRLPPQLVAIAQRLADAPSVEDIERQQFIARLAEKTADAFDWRKLTAPRAKR